MWVTLDCRVVPASSFSVDTTQCPADVAPPTLGAVRLQYDAELWQASILHIKFYGAVRLQYDAELWQASILHIKFYVSSATTMHHCGTLPGFPTPYWRACAWIMDRIPSLPPHWPCTRTTKIRLRRGICCTHGGPEAMLSMLSMLRELRSGTGVVNVLVTTERIGVAGIRAQGNDYKFQSSRPSLEPPYDAAPAATPSPTTLSTYSSSPTTSASVHRDIRNLRTIQVAMAILKYFWNSATG
ncbi:hypothetical protein JB92DRAFT_2825636 [Gautieria morchelliformis]|nr:hypothetical protein JB92DRAFT_2825636 [Gautieria morchelliformis]